MKLARSSVIPIVLDAERISSPEVAALIDQVDHVVGPPGFSAQATGRQGPQHIVSALWNDNQAAVLLTDDANGALTSDYPSQHTHVPTFATDAVDTTGCGGTTLERVRMARAAATAVAVLTAVARRVPTVEEITHLLTFGETR